MKFDTWVDAGHDSWCSVKLTTQGLRFKVNRPGQQWMTFWDACNHTAKCLSNDWAQYPLYLALSGGVDSECVAEALLRNQIKFTPIILDVENVLELETWYAKHWCWRNSIKPILLRLNGHEYERQMLPLMKRIKHTHNQPMPPLFLAAYAEQLGGKLITGLSEINFDLATKRFYNDVMDWAVELFHDTKHPCGFFSYTAELAASYIKAFDIDINEQYNKLQIYSVPPRPKMPTTRALAECTDLSKSILTNFFKNNAASDVNWLGNKDQVLEMLVSTKNET